LSFYLIDANSGQTLASVTIQSASGSRQLSITSLSENSPTPLTPLYISTAGLNPAAPVTIQFSNASGFSVTEQAIRVEADGTVVAAVPVYLAPNTTQIGQGMVSVVVAQGSQSSPQVTLTIQNLPPVSAYGVQPGQISRAVLMMEAILVGRKLNMFQAFQALMGNTIDTSQSQATLNSILNAVIQARSDVDRVSQDSSVVVTGYAEPNGTVVQFDAASLDLMDRISAVFLSQTILPALSALPATPQTADRPELDRRTLASAQNLAQTITKMDDVAAIATLTSTQSAILKAQSVTDAVSAGIGGALSIASALKEFPTATDNVTGGAVGAIVSDVTTIVRCWVDDGTWVAASALGNQNLANAALDDLNAIPIKDELTALGDLATAFPPIAALKYTPVASTVLNSVETLLNVQDATEQMDKQMNDLERSYVLPMLPSQGLAEVYGQAVVGNANGVAASQSEINVSSNGTSFSGIAGSNGYYQVTVPLNVPGFNYASTNVEIVDPIDQINNPTNPLSLGSTVIDLSGLTTTTPFQIPAIQGNECVDDDADNPDADDPDCDESVPLKRLVPALKANNVGAVGLTSAGLRKHRNVNKQVP
jgi:hypothetical protein